jgi:hypothetical protein
MKVRHVLLATLAAGLVLPLAASAQSAAAGSSKLLTYSNAPYGFSLQYPAELQPGTVDGSWSAAADIGYGSGSGTPVVGFTVFSVDQGGVATGRAYPLFFTAEARVGVSNYTAACYPDKGSTWDPYTADEVTINGITFKHTHLDDAGMSKYTSADTYRVIHDGRCYAVDQYRYGSSYRDDSMTTGISDDRLRAYYDEAGAIVRSFRFTDEPPGRAGEGTGTPAGQSREPPVRLSFAQGATMIAANGRVPDSGLVSYVVAAAAGQPLVVSVLSKSLRESLAISGAADGARLLDSAHQTYWQGMLRATEDYLIQVRGGPPVEEFTVNVSTPAPVRFGPSGVSKQVSGHTPGGMPVQYILQARSGQSLLINLVSAGSPDVLEVRGFQDGQTFLASGDGAHQFYLRLPETGDYLISVVPPRAGEGTYTLDIMVPAVELPGGAPIFAFPGLGRACVVQPVRISATASEKTVFSTVDDGRTWRASRDFQTDGWLMDILFVDEDTGYLTSTNGRGPLPFFYNTTDGGAHWSRLALPVPPGIDPQTIRDVTTMHPTFSGRSGVVPAKVHIGDGIYQDFLYNTADGGATWTAVRQ